MPVPFVIRFAIFVMFLCAMCLCKSAFSQEAKTDSSGSFDEWKKSPQGIPKLSQKLVREFSGKNDADRKNDFNELCKLVSNNKLVPAVRYNAVLTIGQLDEKDSKPPVPYSPASAYLVKLYNDSKTPEYVQFGALLGVVRHTYCDIPAGTKTEIQNLLVTTLSSKTEKGDDVAEWKQQTVLDGLSGLKIINSAVGKALFAVIADTDKSIEVRSKAVKVLGDFNYKDTKYDASAIGKNLESFIQSICVTEIEKINRFYLQEKTIQGQSSVNPREKKLEEKRKREALFSSLTAEEQLLVEKIVIETKVSLQSVVYAVNCEKKDNSVGVISAFKPDDANAKKLIASVTKIQTVFKNFDEGSSDIGIGKGTRGAERRDSAAPRDNNAPKAFKLNLYQIKDLLVELSGKPPETFDIQEAESASTDADN